NMNGTSSRMSAHRAKRSQASSPPSSSGSGGGLIRGRPSGRGAGLFPAAARAGSAPPIDVSPRGQFGASGTDHRSGTLPVTTCHRHQIASVTVAPTPKIHQRRSIDRARAPMSVRPNRPEEKVIMLVDHTQPPAKGLVVGRVIFGGEAALVRAREEPVSGAVGSVVFSAWL